MMTKRFLGAVAAVWMVLDVRAEMQAIYISPEGTTNAAYTAEDPGAWQGFAAAQKKVRDAARKQKIALGGERVIFKKGVYKGLSMKLSAQDKRYPLRLEGETGLAEDVVFDGAGSTNRAITTDTRSAFSARGITFCNYKTTGDGGAVMSGTYSNCVFTANAATGSGGAGAGGAQFYDCRFENNTAKRCAAVAGQPGHHYRPRSFLSGCVLKNNIATAYDFRMDGGRRVGYSRNTAIGLYVETTNCTFEAKDSSWWNDTRKLTVKSGDDLAATLVRIRRERAVGKSFKLTLEDGLYPIKEPLELGGEDGDITITAKNKGKAMLTSGWTFRGRDLKKLTDEATLKRLAPSVRGKVYAIDVPAPVVTNLEKRIKEWDFYMPILTVDGRETQLARWPNLPSLITLANSNFVGRVERPGRGGKGVVSNVVISVGGGREKNWDLVSQNGRIMHFSVASFESRRRRMGAYVANPSGIEMPGEFHMPHSAGFFINVLEEIDLPGEWCFDWAKSQLVIYPDGEIRPDAVYVLSQAARGIMTVDADNVRLENLLFTGDHGWAVTIAGGRNNLVAGCRVTGNRYGVYVNGSDNLVTSCDFTYLDDTAVKIEGGDAKKMIASNNRCVNCLMDRCCQSVGGCAHASLSVSGVGNSASHCLIRHTREHAVQWMGLGTVIEYCRMYDTTREYRDSGVMYSGCGFPSHDCHIRYNDVAGSTGQSHGIYPDDFTSGQKIYGNIVRNIGWGAIFLGGGRNNIISNNVITSTGVMALHNDNRGLFWSAWCNKTPESWTAEMVKWVDFIDGPVGKRYPEWKDYAKDDKWLCGNVDNEWVNNIVIDSNNTQDQVCLDKYIPIERQVSKGNVAVGLRRAPCKEVWRFGGFTFADLRKTPDRLFKDVPRAEIITEPGNPFKQYRWRKGDFTPSDDSVLKEIAPEFKEIPFEKIGLYKDDWRDDLCEEPETLVAVDATGDAVSTPELERSVSEAEFKGQKEVKIAISGVGIHYGWLQVKDVPKCSVNVAGNEFKFGDVKPVNGWFKIGEAMLPTGWTGAILKGDDAETAKVLKVVLTTAYDWTPEGWSDAEK